MRTHLKKTTRRQTPQFPAISRNVSHWSDWQNRVWNAFIAVRCPSRFKQTQNRKFGNVNTRTQSTGSKTMQQHIYNVLLFEWQVSGKYTLVPIPPKMQGQLKIWSYYVCCFKENGSRPWLGNPGGYSVIPICQGCGFDPWSGYNKTINQGDIKKWSKKSTNWCFSLSLSLKSTNN